MELIVKVSNAPFNVDLVYKVSALNDRGCFPALHERRKIKSPILGEIFQNDWKSYEQFTDSCCCRPINIRGLV